MADVAIARAAVEDFQRLAAALSLPADTRDRVRRSLAPLVEFPAARSRAGRFLVGTAVPARALAMDAAGV